MPDRRRSGPNPNLDPTRKAAMGDMPSPHNRRRGQPLDGADRALGDGATRATTMAANGSPQGRIYYISPKNHHSTLIMNRAQRLQALNLDPRAVFVPRAEPCIRTT